MAWCRSCRTNHKGSQKCKTDNLMCNCGDKHKDGTKCPVGLKPNPTKPMRKRGWKF